MSTQPTGSSSRIQPGIPPGKLGLTMNRGMSRSSRRKLTEARFLVPPHQAPPALRCDWWSILSALERKRSRMHTDRTITHRSLLGGRIELRPDTEHRSSVSLHAGGSYFDTETTMFAAAGSPGPDHDRHRSMRSIPGPDGSTPPSWRRRSAFAIQSECRRLFRQGKNMQKKQTPVTARRTS